MQEKPHIQRHRLIGEARIKAAVVNAWVIWNTPPLVDIHNFRVKVNDKFWDDYHPPKMWSFNCNGDVVRKY